MDTPGPHTPMSTAVARTRTKTPTKDDRKFEAKDILSCFKGEDKFTFEGPTRHRDGALFLARFDGALRVSSVESVRAIYAPRDSGDDDFSVPECVNAVTFTALLILLTDDATVSPYVLCCATTTRAPAATASRRSPRSVA